MKTKRSRKTKRTERAETPFKWPDDGTRFLGDLQAPSCHQGGSIRTIYVDPDPRLSAMRDAAKSALCFAIDYLTTTATSGSQGPKPLDFNARKCAVEAIALMDAMRELQQLRNGEVA